MLTSAGTETGLAEGVWRDLVAVTEDGTVYRVIARATNTSLVRDGDFSDYRYTITNQWVIIGPQGQEYVGEVVFHGTFLPDGLPSFEFVRFTPDAVCA